MRKEKENGFALDAQEPLGFSNDHESDSTDGCLNQFPNHQEILPYRPMSFEAMCKAYDTICSQYQKNLQDGRYEGLHILKG